MTCPRAIHLGDTRYILEPESVVAPNPQGFFRSYVLHDWQRGGPEFPYRDSSDQMDPPEVNRIGKFDDRTSHNKVALNEGMQFFWAELMSLHKFRRNLADLNTDERKYIDAKMDVAMGPAFGLTNRGRQPAANYVSGEYLDIPPARMAPLICGGSTILTKPVGANNNGTQMVQVHSWLSTSQFPTPTLSTLLDPRVLWLTAIYGVGKVLPFTTLGIGVGVPYPLITAESYFYPRDGVMYYNFEDPPISQYVPARLHYP